MAIARSVKFIDPKGGKHPTRAVNRPGWDKFRSGHSLRRMLANAPRLSIRRKIRDQIRHRDEALR